MSSIGSETASQDLYGLGVRVGMYLQGAGMILCLMRSRHSGTGIKLASGTIVVSILMSWTIAVSHAELSPSEAYLILHLLLCIMAPGRMVLFSIDAMAGEGLGLLLVTVAGLWTSAMTGWFFARLCLTLPRLGTKNLGFFFARVRIDRWFRIFSLVTCAYDWIVLLLTLKAYIRALGVTISVYLRGGTALTEAERTKADILSARNLVAWQGIPSTVMTEDTVKNMDQIRGYVRLAMPILLWMLSVVSVETTILWNGLSPSTELSSPGQLIPFVTGIFIFLDGFLVMVRPHEPKKSEFHDGNYELLRRHPHDAAIQRV